MKAENERGWIAFVLILRPSSFVISLVLFLFALFLIGRFVEQFGQAGFVADLDLDEPAGLVGIVGQVFEVVGQWPS